jgi:hypothetical protein
MKTMTGVFESGDAAREAVRHLHEAGVSEDDIAFLLADPKATEPIGPAEQGERTGEQLGRLVADVGQTAAAFVPFIGRNLGESPVARALRETAETTGASAGRLFGALSEGGLHPPDRGAGPPRARASVVVRLGNVPAAGVRTIFVEAGAIRIDTEP